MAPLTSHFYLFAHNPRLPDVRSRRIAQGYPDEGEGVQYNHQNRPAVIAVSNTVSTLGMPALFPILPELLAPDNGGLYHNILPDIADDIRALFIWEPLDITARIQHHYARHVVHFQIFTEAPHNAVHLALVLLRLIDNANSERSANSTSANSSRIPKLKDLSYSITPSSVYASAYFTGFELAYANANASTTWNRYFSFTCGDRELPLTTWPDNRRDLATTELVLDCYTTVQSLIRI